MTTIEQPVRASAPPAEQFPVKAFPRGWYVVRFSDELARSLVEPLRCFGVDLVLWRDADGAAHLMDAFCPHLGAHIGYGGRVEGNDLVCPYHEWKFNCRGRNVEIPYAERPNIAARIRTWVVEERDGYIWAWYDPDGREPAWDVGRVPEFSSGDFAEPTRSFFTTVAHPQEVYENVVDMAHFVSVHQAMRVDAQVDLEIDGPHLLVTSKNQMLKSRSGYFPAVVQSELMGLGLDVARISGVIDTVISLTLTPVDIGHTDVRFAVSARERGGTSEFPPEKVARLVEKAQERVIIEFKQDLEIWQRKRYLPNLKLAPSEKGIIAYRQWAQQFYQ